MEPILTRSGQAQAIKSPLLNSRILKRAFEGRPVLRSTVLSFSGLIIVETIFNRRGRICRGRICRGRICYTTNSVLLRPIYGRLSALTGQSYVMSRCPSKYYGASYYKTKYYGIGRRVTSHFALRPCKQSYVTTNPSKRNSSTYFGSRLGVHI